MVVSDTKLGARPKIAPFGLILFQMGCSKMTCEAIWFQVNRSRFSILFQMGFGCEPKGCEQISSWVHFKKKHCG